MKDVDQLTIVSNRLPIVMQHGEDGWHIEPGSGGLVQAMIPILERLGGRWIGWPGLAAEDGNGWLPRLDEVTEGMNYTLKPVILRREEVEGFYAGFSNSVIWPLFHGFPDRCNFDAEFFHTYEAVNQKFADVIACQTGGNDFLWVHDYHLMHVGQKLRAMGQDDLLAFFLHIPFPSVENFTKLPWRQEILEALMAYDLVGFQTERDRANFVQCITRLLPRATITDRGEGEEWLVHLPGSGALRLGVFPIGTHYRDFNTRAATPAVAQRVVELHQEIGRYKMLLGIDRLDYTKGLIERFLALEHALEAHPDLCEQIVLFQLVIPSREKVPEYVALKMELDQVIGRINGRFSTTSWQPIHYLYNTVEPDELSALYRLAHAAIVTPLRDGMNLVAKEYCASQVDEHGVLVLSEFAGAAAQLGRGALLVNPYDLEATSRAIHQAVTMPESERRRRMRRLRRVVQQSDVFWWANQFCDAALRPFTPSRPGAATGALGSGKAEPNGVEPTGAERSSRSGLGPSQPAAP